MPSTYTTSLRLTLPATGELAGTWGTTVNAGVTSLAEAAIAGTAAVTMIDADYTLTAVNGAADQARNMFVTLTGTLSTARNVICPPVSKLYFVTNNTTGGYAITFKTLAGTGISVPNGQRAVVYCNGTDVLGGLTALDSLSLNGSLTLVGGTANGVLYLNGSKAVTSGSALTFNGTNLGVGVTSPSQKLDILGGIAVRAATSGANQDIIALRALNSDNTAYANAIYYANSHRWAYAGATEGMRLDSSGNLGLGVTPSAWGSNHKAFEVAGASTGHVVAYVNQLSVGRNYHQTNTDIFYTYTGQSAQRLLLTNDGQFQFLTAPSGTAGNPITFTQAMTLDASGNLGIGTASTGNYRLRVDATNRSLYVTTAGATAALPSVYLADSTHGVDIVLTPENGYGRFGTFTNSPLAFITNNTERMRLDASGNLGIGKTPSLTQLQVKQSTTYAFGIDNSNETQNYSWRVDTGAGSPLILGTRTTSTDLLWLSAAGNLGLGVTPNATNAAFRAFEVGNFTFFSGAGGLSSYIDNNAFFNASGQYRYKHSGYAGEYAMFTSDGSHRWYTAPSGTAGNAISFTQAMTLDASGNLGLGVTPSAWNTSFKALEYSAGYVAAISTNELDIGQNNFYSASLGTWTYKNTAGATQYRQTGSEHRWYTAPSGTAGNAITFTQAMTLDASGTLVVGGATNTSRGGAFTEALFTKASGTNYIDIQSGASDSVGLLFSKGSTGNYGAVQYLNASDALQFYTASSERARLTSSGNLGIGTASPTSTLHVSGSFSRGVPVTKTANFTLTDTENWVIVNNSTSSVTATLPAPSSFPGRELMFVARYATGGGNLVSASSNVVQPDGTVTNVIIPYDVSGRYKFSTIVSDGTNWVVMNRGIM